MIYFTIESFCTTRSWLAIDSDIYFWVYEDGSDVAYYDGIKEVILAAELITPKPGACSTK